MLKRDSKIYVAGHRGLVGSAILRRLQAGRTSSLITRTSAELDLRRQADTERFFEKERPEYVFLAAAKVGGILANNTYRAAFIYDNIMIAANAIHSSFKYGAKKLLNLGSSCIYPKHAPQPMKEEYLLTGLLESTNEPYAIAKISAIKLCQYYNDQYGTKFISVMPTNLYGSQDNFNLETAHVLPSLIRKFHLGKLFQEKNYDAIEKDFHRFPVGFHLDYQADPNPVLEKLGITADHISLWGSGEPYREFLHVDDLSEAAVFLMEHYNSNEIINVGTGEDLPIKELAGLVRKTVGYKGEIRWDKSNPDGTPRKLLDVSKIKSLGWLPKISLEEGIRKTYDWYITS
jgi:GDP-L-fucose synthase